MPKERYISVTKEYAESIQDWGEKVFATAVTSKENLIVKYQIPIRGKVIDFWVKNTKMNGSSKGMLVEVTKTPLNKSHNKRGQRRAMEEEGLPHTILFKENLVNIDTNANKRDVTEY
ncbi:MAG: hypothetical protein UV71_C0013G0014 [Microgenomates group bacterium GW2011_GWC1_43_13]|nr:MAG: hypothetical protein UV71_C0013G0014 [Microgenomates group bacterium GW2011_GWC1_43_13]